MSTVIVYTYGTVSDADHIRVHKKDGGEIVEDFRTHVFSCAKCREVIGARQMKEDTEVIAK